MMLFRKYLLDIIDYAYSQAHDSEICVCPSCVPDWNDHNLSDEMVAHQLHTLRVVRKYFEEYDTNRRFVHPNTVCWLISRFMETEYQTELLACVCQRTFDILKSDMITRFEELSVTEDDIKTAWKEWFEYAATNGTLISPHFYIQDKEAAWRHPELKVSDMLVELAWNSIDNL